VPFAVEDEGGFTHGGSEEGGRSELLEFWDTRFERGDPHGLLVDDGEQMDDHLAHDQRGLFPMGRVKRKPCGQWERGSHRTSFRSRHERRDLQPDAI
jgi:hypothetical protein